jgi:hypothetical protein
VKFILALVGFLSIGLFIVLEKPPIVKTNSEFNRADVVSHQQVNTASNPIRGRKLVTSEPETNLLGTTDQFNDGVVRVGPRLDIPDPNSHNNLVSMERSVTRVGKDLIVGAIEYSEFYTDEVQSEGDLLDVYDMISDGIVKEIVFDGTPISVGSLGYSETTDEPVIIGRPVSVEDNRR